MTGVLHDRPAQRFTVQLDGLLARLDYELGARVMRITHTHVPPEFRGRGVAAHLMEAALDYASREQLTVDPICSYALAYMQRTVAGRPGPSAGDPSAVGGGS